MYILTLADFGVNGVVCNFENIAYERCLECGTVNPNGTLEIVLSYDDEVHKYILNLYTEFKT